MRNVGFFFLFLLAHGCSEREQTPNPPIHREKFVQVYTDLLIAGEFGRLSPADSARQATASPEADSIFARHGVTEGQVRETVREYSKDLRMWKEFYDEVIQRLEKIEREEQERKRS